MFAPFHNFFFIGFWNCSESVEFFFFISYIPIPVLRGHLWDKEKVAYKTGDLLKEVQFIYIYENFYDRSRKIRPLNTGDCLIEVTAWAGLTVHS